MTAEDVFYGLRVVHIIGGSIALLAGYAALFVKRGGDWHRRFGRYFVNGMATVAVTGLPMSIIRPNPFLFGIVIFSSYLIFSGRAAAMNRTGEAGKLDFGAAALLFATSVIALLAVAYISLSGIEYPMTFLITGTVFAIIGLITSHTDWKMLRAGPIRGKDRIIKHLGGMCAGLIAATTAVAATIISRLPDIPNLIAWLGPTLIISPLIAYWTRQVREGSAKN